jgi:hypothetical protein
MRISTTDHFALGVLALVALLLAMPAQAQNVGTAHAVPIKPSKPAAAAIKEPVTAAGCRNAAQPGKPYFVEFRSRTAASYGHTFVFFGRLGTGNKFASFDVAGLHPAGDNPATYIKGHVVPVPAETGVSYGDLDEQYLTARFCITLSENEFIRVSRYIRWLQSEHTMWHAPTYNCNVFAADIAKFVGLDAPNPNLYLPEKFINRLAELNKTPPSAAPKLSAAARSRGL